MKHSLYPSALCLLIAYALTLPVAAETQSSPSDIWQEISFQAEEDHRITEKQVEQLMYDLGKSDPEKAKELKRIRTENPQQFIEFVRNELKRTTEPLAPAEREKTQEPSWKPSEEHADFFAWFAKEYNEETKDLAELQKAQSDKYTQRVADVIKIYEPIYRTERMNPRLAAAMKEDLLLQRKRDAILVQMRIASSDEQAKLKQTLEEITAARFDIIVLKKELQYDWLRRRLERLQQQLESHAREMDELKKNKDQAVSERLKELLQRTERVDWN